MHINDAHEALATMKQQLKDMGYETADVWLRIGPGFNYLNVWTDHNEMFSGDVRTIIREAADYISGLMPVAA